MMLQVTILLILTTFINISYTSARTKDQFVESGMDDDDTNLGTIPDNTDISIHRTYKRGGIVSSNEFLERSIQNFSEKSQSTLIVIDTENNEIEEDGDDVTHAKKSEIAKNVEEPFKDGFTIIVDNNNNDQKDVKKDAIYNEMENHYEEIQQKFGDVIKEPLQRKHVRLIVITPNAEETENKMVEPKQTIDDSTVIALNETEVKEGTSKNGNEEREKNSELEVDIAKLKKVRDQMNRLQDMNINENAVAVNSEVISPDAPSAKLDYHIDKNDNSNHDDSSVVEVTENTVGDALAPQVFQEHKLNHSTETIHNNTRVPLEKPTNRPIQSPMQLDKHRQQHQQQSHEVKHFNKVKPPHEVKSVHEVKPLNEVKKIYKDKQLNERKINVTMSSDTLTEQPTELENNISTDDLNKVVKNKNKIAPPGNPHPTEHVNNFPLKQQQKNEQNNPHSIAHFSDIISKKTTQQPAHITSSYKKPSSSKQAQQINSFTYKPTPLLVFKNLTRQNSDKGGNVFTKKADDKTNDDKINSDYYKENDISIDSKAENRMKMETHQTDNHKNNMKLLKIVDRVNKPVVENILKYSGSSRSSSSSELSQQQNQTVIEDSSNEIKSTNMSTNKQATSIESDDSDVKPPGEQQHKLIDNAKAEAIIEFLNKDPLETWRYPFNTLTSLDLNATILRSGLVNPGDIDRLKGVMKRALNGKDIVLSIVGGSISAGGGLYKDLKSIEGLYYKGVVDWWNKMITPLTGSEMVINNVAIGSIGTDYFSYCVKNHIRPDTDIVIWELSANDYNRYKNRPTKGARPLERLTRTVLELPKRPALIYLNFFKGIDYKNSRDSCPNFEDQEEDVIAHYYKIPSLSWRAMVCKGLVLNQEGFKMENLFSRDQYHPSIKGHAQASLLILLHLRHVMRAVLQWATQHDGTVKSFDETNTLPDPLFIGPKYPHPYCWTLISPNISAQITNTLQVRVMKDEGYEMKYATDFPVRYDKVACWKAEKPYATLSIFFTIPESVYEESSNKRYEISITTHTRWGGSSFIWLDDNVEKSTVIREGRPGDPGKRTQVDSILSDVTAGTHTLNIQSSESGFCLSAIMVDSS